VATGADGNHIRIPIRIRIRIPIRIRIRSLPRFFQASAFCPSALSAKKCRLNLFNMLPNYFPADVDGAPGSGVRGQ